MKLCTFEYMGFEKVGLIIDEHNLADVNMAYAKYLYNREETKAYKIATVMTPPSMLKIIEGGDSSWNAIRELKQAVELEPRIKGPRGEKIIYPLANVKLKAPIPRPPKILAPSVNHKQGWANTTVPATDYVRPPGYVIKLATCVTGPYDPVEIPDIGVVGSEIEVGAVIARKGKHIPVQEAEEYIFGYTVVNDITAHELRDTKEWYILKTQEGEELKITYFSRYKCFDTFLPMGPWIVTRDEIPNIYDCSMEARIQNKPIQQGSTSDLVLKFPELISFFSSAHTLEPGDVILGGTCKAAPGQSLLKTGLRKIGGVLESEVEGIGTLKNPIKPI